MTLKLLSRTPWPSFPSDRLDSGILVFIRPIAVKFGFVLPENRVFFNI